MKTIFRATDRFLEDVRRDLSRPHPFAAERVGFISVRATNAGDDALVLLAADYHPLADDEYVDDSTVGAMMGQEAIRKALEVALLRSVGMIHVHMHEHHGRPPLPTTRTGIDCLNTPCRLNRTLRGRKQNRFGRQS